MRISTHLLLFVSCFLVACQSPVSIETLGTYSDSSLKSLKRKEVLVVGYAYDSKIRTLFEDRMTAALKAEGIDAEPSYRRLPALQAITSQSLAQYLGSAPSAAVLFTEAKAVVRNETSKASGSGMSLFDFADGQWQTETNIKVQTSLFISGNSSHVWQTLQDIKTKGASPVDALVAEIVKQLP